MSKKVKWRVKGAKLLAELSLYFAVACGSAYGALRQGWPPEILAVSVIAGGWTYLFLDSDGY
jgi:hypothetical protein